MVSARIAVGLRKVTRNGHSQLIGTSTPKICAMGGATVLDAMQKVSGEASD